LSVYKPAKSPFYAYDFQIRQIRFSGSTECTSKRDAETFEKQRKIEARIEVAALTAQENAPLNFATAAARYYLQVGQHLRGDGPKNCQWSLDWLENEIGGATRLAAIDDATVAKLVGIRRGEGVKPATVNRSATEPLRKILNRARDTWGQKVVKIDWKHHMLSEPRERVREMSHSEEISLFGELRADYQPVVRFAMQSGCRLCEIVPGKEFPGLRWPDVDWSGRKITVLGKGGVLGTIPISPGIRELLFPLQGNHDEFVFTYIAQKTRDGRVNGERYPMTREGLKTEWRRAKLDAKLLDYRFHDNRHTAATGILRATGNLKAIQKLLRHNDIATTAKYAHAMIDDVRDAMEAGEKSRNKSRTDDAEAAKPLAANGENT
jgi:integrase